MSTRGSLWAFAWLIAFDRLAYVTFAWPFYLVGLAQLPNPDETISSIVGRMSLKGYRWARISEAGIDRLFQLLGSDPGHCRRAIIAAEITKAPT